MARKKMYNKKDIIEIISEFPGSVLVLDTTALVLYDVLDECGAIEILIDQSRFDMMRYLWSLSKKQTSIDSPYEYHMHCIIHNTNFDIYCGDITDFADYLEQKEVEEGLVRFGDSDHMILQPELLFPEYNDDYYIVSGLTLPEERKNELGLGFLTKDQEKKLEKVKDTFEKLGINRRLYFDYK